MRNSSKTLSLYKKFLDFFEISNALRGCLKNHLVTLNIFTVALIPRKKAALKTNHEAKKAIKKENQLLQMKKSSLGKQITGKRTLTQKISPFSTNFLCLKK